LAKTPIYPSFGWSQISKYMSRLEILGRLPGVPQQVPDLPDCQFHVSDMTNSSCIDQWSIKLSS
jgi:hypothetical protein